MKNNILILSISPFSLIESYTLLKDKNLLKEKNIYVYHYEHTTNLINLTEKYLSRILGFQYEGQIGRVTTLFDNQSKIKKMSLLLNLFLWKRIRKKLFNNIDFNNIEYIVMPYRPYFSDILLRNMFSDKIKVYYVSDGYLIKHPKNFKLSFWKNLIFKNHYKYKNYNEIYCYQGMDYRMNQFGNAKLLSNNGIKDIIYKLQKNKYYQDNIAKYNMKNTSISMFVSQNLFPRFISNQNDEVELYYKIIKSNLLPSDICYIKYHPRDNQQKKDLLKERFKNEKNILFIENNTFGTLPLELLVNDLKINQIIGFSSTSIATLSFLYPKIKMTIYLTGIKQIDNESKLLLNDLGIVEKRIKDI